MVLRITVSFAALMLSVSQLFATPLPIKRYEASPTTFQRNAAELGFFSWGDSLGRAELFSGPNNPGDDGNYNVMGNPATGTKAVLDLAGIGPFDPSLSTLTFDVQWTVPLPPNGMWSNGFADNVQILDVNGQFTQVDAAPLFGCSGAGASCQAPNDLSRTAQVAISDLTNYIVSPDQNEIEIVIDYYDGDTQHQLGPESTDPPFTVDNFDLVVPEPACLQLLLLSMAIAWCRRARTKVC